MSTLRIARLMSNTDWDALHFALDKDKTNQAIYRIITHLKEVGVVFCIIEGQYLDQDFTEIYASFYAGLFKRHYKLCHRFSFFKQDLTNIFNQPSGGNIFEVLTSDTIKASFAGFAVIRPIKHAPLGRAVIEVPPAPVAHRSVLMVKSKHRIHLCGATFEIDGIEFTQQDSRVGSCAQASIWMAGRHFHHKHKGPWVSTVAITKAATSIADNVLSRMVPAGSEALSLDNMIRALKSMDREPYIYTAESYSRESGVIIWNQRPKDIIHRYVDSGIPVILGMSPLPGENVGHAFIAAGVTYETRNPGVFSASKPTRAEFARYFIVNDDQRGANIRLPIQNGLANSETEYTVENNLLYLIIPLPKKVYIPAEHAEALAWNTLENYASQWSGGIKPVLSGTNTECADNFVEQITNNNVVCRTYLTFGWKYKARMLANSVSEELRNRIIYHELPRYVWVTEFGTDVSLGSVETKDHNIFAHCVVDATAHSEFWEARLLFHAPGWVITWQHNENISEQFGEYTRKENYIIDDNKYRPKIRGAMDLSPFE